MEKEETNDNQWQSSSTFDVFSTAADPDSKLLRLNLVGLIHEKTEMSFVLY